MNALRYLLFILIFSTFYRSFSQTYTLYTFIAPYDTLTGATAVDETNPDTVHLTPVYEKIPIGFDFEFDGLIYDSLRPTKDGFVIFSDSGIYKNWISIFDANLIDFKLYPQNSPILYELTGLPGDRIFKLEYKNVGFKEDPEFDDFVNFQLWIYENCGNVEMRIGQYSINSDVFWNSFPAPFIGLGTYVEPKRKYLFITGDQDDPELEDTSTVLNGVPEPNRVYTFAKCIVGEEEFEKVPVIEVYPNPVDQYAQIRLNNSYDKVEITLINLQGQVVRSGNYSHTTQIRLDMDDLPAGMYLLNLVTPSGSRQVKLLKN